MDINDIKDLLQCISALNLNEINIETSSIKLFAKKISKNREIDFDNVGTSLEGDSNFSYNSISVDRQTNAKGIVANNIHQVVAPMVGTFYLANCDGDDPFVKIGDRVEIGQKICIIEAMKIFNEIESDVAGIVTDVLVINDSPVFYGQVLFSIQKGS